MKHIEFIFGEIFHTRIPEYFNDDRKLPTRNIRAVYYLNELM